MAYKHAIFVLLEISCISDETHLNKFTPKPQSTNLDTTCIRGVCPVGNLTPHRSHPHISTTSSAQKTPGHHHTPGKLQTRPHCEGIEPLNGATEWNAT